MNIVENLEIHFHDQERVSVFLESNVSDQDEKFGELALASMYAIRMLSNLGKNDTSQKLASLLSAASQFVSSVAIGATTGGFELVTYPGYQGRKRFIATLRITDTGCRLDLSPKGFGIFATGMGYYGPVSVMALLRYLAAKRSSDSAFLAGLGSVSALCGHFYLGGQITMTNHAQLALSALASSGAVTS